jgi:alkylation response protein AidB-like acyl-CoA dehydrogenase
MRCWRRLCRFATEVIAPPNTVGDRHGVLFKDGTVTTPPGWKEAYRAWTAAGWNALAAPAPWGGQELPHALNAACIEMWNSAAMAFGLGPVLTMAGVDALVAHGTDELKRTYLPKLVSGEWMGTMQLTEPQAGSDVGALRTRAERAGDGTYRITGQKIFITYGEHDLTDNIIHLVLARLPGAPAGTRGISLFWCRNSWSTPTARLGPAMTGGALDRARSAFTPRPPAPWSMATGRCHRLPHRREPAWRACSP